MKFFFIIIIINYFCIIYSDPDVKHFYIESNKLKCALLDISSDIQVFYLTGNGYNNINLNLSQSQPNQSGLCDNVTEAQFNISIPPTELLSFNFKNTNQMVNLTSIQFTYQLPNVNFPDSVQPAGIFTKNLHTNFVLSNSTSFYQCNSKMQFNISNDIMLNIYKVKVKVYNVINNTFGNEKQECSQDFQNQTTTTSPEISSRNSEATSKITANTDTTISITTSTHSTFNTSDSSIKSTTSKYSTSNSYSSSTSPSVKTTSSSPVSTTSNPDKYLFYIVDSRTGNVCLILRTNLTIEITYENTKNKNSQKRFEYITNDNISGYCNIMENVLDIKWISGISFRMNFTSDKTFSSLSALSLNYTLSSSSFPGSLHPGKIISSSDSIGEDCKTRNGNGYSCSTLTYKFDSATVTLNNFKYEAFRESKSKTFSSNEIDCKNKSPIVPIVVGAVLAVFLVIVVIIFLIFRYRNKRTNGYETI